MFGYITPLYNELKLGDYYYFKSYYCGLCNTIKENFGNIPRLTLNYDLTFIGFLLDGLSNEPINNKAIHCIKHLTSETIICQPTNALNYISDINIIISSLKLKDDIVDEGNIKSWLFHTLFLPSNKKARKHLKLLVSIVDENMDILSGYEKNLNFTSLDEVCHPFSVIMASILSLYPYSFQNDSSKTRETLYNLGYSIGKWIYLMDALDDWNDDLNNNRFNPLNAIYNVNSIPFKDIINSVIEDIDFIIFSCLNNCNEYMKALPFKKHYSIIENVINLGMPQSYYSIIFKLKDLINLKEASST
ncbi:MAG: DUF5685 family protein [Clostridium sp.]|nr:DUF5685 family protein [Clostridium sp.]